LRETGAAPFVVVVTPTKAPEPYARAWFAQTLLKDSKELDTYLKEAYASGKSAFVIPTRQIADATIARLREQLES
jgi:hypothetical protein